MSIIILAIMFRILYVISFTSFISTITLHSGIYYPLLPQSSDRLSHLSKVTQQVHSSARLCTHVCLKSILGAPAPLWGRKYIKGGVEAEDPGQQKEEREADHTMNHWVTPRGTNCPGYRAMMSPVSGFHWFLQTHVDTTWSCRENSSIFATERT